jgi:hypothetical protein
VKIHTPCTAVALYGHPGELNLPESMATSLSLFEELGFTPDSMGVMGEGFSGKAASFDRTRKRLDKAGFEGVKGIDVFATAPGYRQIAFGWRVTASLNQDAGAVIFGFDHGAREPEPGFLDDVTLRYRQSFEFRYGIAYERDLVRGPVLYAYGMSAGLGYSPEDMREADRIAKWQRQDAEGKTYLTGALRDVYPQNWLTEAHQTGAGIAGVGLLDWIRASPTRGSVTQLASDVWSWSIELDQIDAVRAALDGEGRLISA